MAYERQLHENIPRLSMNDPTIWKRKRNIGFVVFIPSWNYSIDCVIFYFCKPIGIVTSIICQNLRWWAVSKCSLDMKFNTYHLLLDDLVGVVEIISTISYTDRYDICWIFIAFMFRY